MGGNPKVNSVNLITLLLYCQSFPMGEAYTLYMYQISMHLCDAMSFTFNKSSAIWCFNYGDVINGIFHLQTNLMLMTLRSDVTCAFVVVPGRNKISHD